jgi:hypothetical protein
MCNYSKEEKACLWEEEKEILTPTQLKIRRTLADLLGQYQGISCYELLT